jgi:hypothetical protein
MSDDQRPSSVMAAERDLLLDPLGGDETDLHVVFVRMKA